MTDPRHRFSERVANYARFRPDYPAELVPALLASSEIGANPVIADVGPGSGSLGAAKTATLARSTNIRVNYASTFNYSAEVI